MIAEKSLRQLADLKKLEREICRRLGSRSDSDQEM
jgi:hypothetical protein